MEVVIPWPELLMLELAALRYMLPAWIPTPADLRCNPQDAGRPPQSTAYTATLR